MQVLILSLSVGELPSFKHLSSNCTITVVTILWCSVGPYMNNVIIQTSQYNIPLSILSTFPLVQNSKLQAIKDNPLLRIYICSLTWKTCIWVCLLQLLFQILYDILCRLSNIFRTFFFINILNIDCSKICGGTFFTTNYDKRTVCSLY